MTLDFVIPVRGNDRRRQPDHGVRVVRLRGVRASTIDQGDEAPHGYGLSPRRIRAEHRKHRNQDQHAIASFCSTQNSTPTPKLTWSAVDLAPYLSEVHSRRYSSESSRFERT